VAHTEILGGEKDKSETVFFLLMWRVEVTNRWLNDTKDNHQEEKIMFENAIPLQKYTSCGCENKRRTKFHSQVDTH
jgi:hypothetical protein